MSESITLKQCANKENCVHPEKQGDGWLPATTKYFRATQNGNLRGKCRAEERAYVAQKYWENPQVSREKERHWRESHSDQARAKQKRYRDTHKEEQKQRNKEWELKNHERRLEYFQTYRDEHRAELKERGRRYNETHREERLEAYRLYNETHREERAAYSRAYHWAHREERLAYNHAHKHERRNKAMIYRVIRRKERREYNRHYHLNHKEEEREYRRLYRSVHRLENRFKSHKRRTLKRSLPYAYTLSDWGRAIDYFNGCCAVCGRQLHDLLGTHKAAADHWIPLTSPRCPGTIPANIVPLCHGENGCNNRKSKRDPLEFIETEFGKRRAKEILARINAYFEWVKTPGGD